VSEGVCMREMGLANGVKVVSAKAVRAGEVREGGRTGTPSAAQWARSHRSIQERSHQQERWNKASVAFWLSFIIKESGCESQQCMLRGRKWEVKGFLGVRFLLATGRTASYEKMRSTPGWV
jgi:hypothetical protein